MGPLVEMCLPLVESILVSSGTNHSVARCLVAGRVDGMSTVDWKVVNEQRRVFGLAYLIAAAKDGTETQKQLHKYALSIAILTK